MKERYLVELVTYRKYGIKRGHRLLKDHRYLSAADSRHLACRHFCYIEYLFFGFVFKYARFVSRLNGNEFRVTVFIEYRFAFAVFRFDGFNDFVAVFVHSGLVNGNRIALFVFLVFHRLEANFTLYDLPLRSLYKLHERKARNGLSATRLADYSYDGIFGNRERNAVYGFGNARIRKEISVKILEFYDILRIFHLRRIFAFGNVFTLFAFFEITHRVSVFLSDLPRFLRGEVMFFQFFFICFIRHIIASSSSGRTRL